jgi:hypothetical protein
MTIAFAFSAIRHLKIFPASNMINKAQKKMSTVFQIKPGTGEKS